MSGAPNRRRKMTREEKSKRNEKKERRRAENKARVEELTPFVEELETRKRAHDSGIVLAQPGDLLGIPKEVQDEYFKKEKA